MIQLHVQQVFPSISSLILVGDKQCYIGINSLLLQCKGAYDAKVESRILSCKNCYMIVGFQTEYHKRLHKTILREVLWGSEQEVKFVLAPNMFLLFNRIALGL